MLMDTARRKKKKEEQVQKMPSSLPGFLLITVLHVAAIVLFTRGFLLTRTELPYFSNCSDLSQSPCKPPPHPHLNTTSTTDRCWTRPAVDRLVIIVFDALRFDFVAPSTFFKEKQPWMDKLKVMHKVASEKRSSARIFKAIADPPTTSLQRLKGLTTGGLPTFIDVGNSFGAPAIIEDNLIYQLAQNGKKVLMMGDDTWLELFPRHFNRSYPYPSFNVKDLDTVDDGCIKHLFPSLLRDDWDVLIAHFLGVDHAGHIFGVDSDPMFGKLEQYNALLQEIIDVLESHSGPGGLHENTLLLVMGDHGQTINGDHGGGGAEEVETAIFAMGLKEPPDSLPLDYDSSNCQLDLEGRMVCYSSIEQLDFAVTVSALLGVPFPFGSIGRVNPELYALAAGTWKFDDPTMGTSRDQSVMEEWLLNYINVLCINSWQVNRYIDVYSASSLMGFSHEDILRLSVIYSRAMEKWSLTATNLDLHKNENGETLLYLRSRVDAHFSFLASVAELSRSKWTEFNLQLMGIGLAIMLISLLVHFHIIRRLDRLYAVYCLSNLKSGMSLTLAFPSLIVAFRACSFLSNSFILEEGKVACFLAATTGVLSFRHSISRKNMILQGVGFLLIISILRFSIELKLSKQDAGSILLNMCSSWMLDVAGTQALWTHMAELVPVLFLIALAFMLHFTVARQSSAGIMKHVITGTSASYLLIGAYWVSESSLLNLPLLHEGLRGNFIPRVIYAIGCVQLLSLVLISFLDEGRTSNWEEKIVTKAVAIVSAWSSTVIILSGRQGAFVALASIVGGWSIVHMKNLEQDSKSSLGTLSLFPFPVTQWSLLAVCLFFCTGHWCAFDGLRYAAAFIGFDEFTFIPQAILLTIDTFGFSHIIPILGLPFLVAHQHLCSQTERGKQSFFIELSQVYLMYGLITATTFTFTMVCVAIQRRHLMVWGLFAPKFVFDVVALILTDALIFLAMLYYGRVENDRLSVLQSK